MVELTNGHLPSESDTEREKRSSDCIRPDLKTVLLSFRFGHAGDEFDQILEEGREIVSALFAPFGSAGLFDEEDSCGHEQTERPAGRTSCSTHCGLSPGDAILTGWFWPNSTLDDRLSVLVNPAEAGIRGALRIPDLALMANREGAGPFGPDHPYT